MKEIVATISLGALLLSAAMLMITVGAVWNDMLSAHEALVKGSAWGVIVIMSIGCIVLLEKEEDYDEF